MSHMWHLLHKITFAYEQHFAYIAIVWSLKWTWYSVILTPSFYSRCLQEKLISIISTDFHKFDVFKFIQRHSDNDSNTSKVIYGFFLNKKQKAWIRIERTWLFWQTSTLYSQEPVRGTVQYTKSTCKHFKSGNKAFFVHKMLMGVSQGDVLKTDDRTLNASNFIDNYYYYHNSMTALQAWQGIQGCFCFLSQCVLDFVQKIIKFLSSLSTQNTI